MTQVKFQTAAFTEAFNFLKECTLNTKNDTDTCVAFQVNDEGVLMYTSNCRYSASYLVNDNVEISGEGTFLVFVDDIVKALSASKKESITFLDDDKQIVVQYGGTKTKLNKINGSINPPTMEEPNVVFKDNPFKFASKMFFSCGQDCGYAMSGIHLDFNEEQRYMTACCRTSVYSKEIDVEGEPCAKEFNIRQEIVKLLAKLDGDIQAKLEGTNAFFSAGPVTIYSTLIDGRYPKWRVAIAEGGSKVVINRASMLDACTSSLCGKEDIGIKFSFGPVCVAESKKKGRGGSTTELEVVGTTTCTMEVTLDPSYIKSFLSANPDVNADMEVFHDKVVFTAEGQKFVIAAMC